MGIGAIAGGIGGLFGAASQAAANRDATNLGYRNLYLQRDIADKNYALNTAARTDAYGNTLQYIPGVGWKVKLTPGSKAQLDANSFENLKRSTVDADRNRRGQEANELRRVGANEAYDAALRNYRYGSSPDTASIETALIQQSNNANNDFYSKMRDALVTGAVRTGNSSAVSNIIKSTAQEQAKSVRDNLLNARIKALSVGQQLQNQDQNQKLSQLTGLDRIGGNVGTSPLGTDNTDEFVQKTQADALRGISGALTSGAEAQGNALLNAAKLRAQSFTDLSNPLKQIGSGIGDYIAASGQKRYDNQGDF